MRWWRGGGEVAAGRRACSSSMAVLAVTVRADGAPSCRQTRTFCGIETSTTMSAGLEVSSAHSGRQRSAQSVVITSESATRGSDEWPSTMTWHAAAAHTRPRSLTSCGRPCQKWKRTRGQRRPRTPYLRGRWRGKRTQLSCHARLPRAAPTHRLDRARGACAHHGARAERSEPRRGLGVRRRSKAWAPLT